MKPLSECTTPRRLMAPISRHFLPVLQPEPPAWLTTGLMKGSRLPFALYLLSGTTVCSFAPRSRLLRFPKSRWPAAVAAAGGSFWGAAAADAAGELPATASAQTRFARPCVSHPPDLGAAGGRFHRRNRRRSGSTRLAGHGWRSPERIAECPGPHSRRAVARLLTAAHGVARVLDNAGTLGPGQARGQYRKPELPSLS